MNHKERLKRLGKLNISSGVDRTAYALHGSILPEKSQKQQIAHNIYGAKPCGFFAISAFDPFL